MESYLRRGGREELIIVPFCKSGRHRSLANGKLTIGVIRQLYPQISYESHHLSEGSSWKYTCKGECPECKAETPAMEAMVKEARDIAVMLWKESMEPIRPKMTGAAARATSRPPDAREAKTIMKPRSKKMPERHGPSRAKSVAPPLRRELFWQGEG